jgi:hypothetical protein
MTARPWFANGARALLEARKAGNVPDGPVAVACCPGPFSGAGAVLFVTDDMPTDRLDWRMLVNLEVWLWADGSVPLERVLGLARKIAMVRPKRLVLRFNHEFRFEWRDSERVHLEQIDTHDVDIGSGYHIPAIRDLRASHDFIWFPFNTSGTPIAERLKNAICKQFGAYEFL